MTPKAKYYETLANTMIKNFEKRRMEAYYCPTAKEAVEKALSFLPSGAVVAHGGSMTLEETGMMDALRSADIQFLDRAVCKTPEDSRKIFHDALMADYYFMSTNAMTIDGELVNIDGNGNRVAALIYSPENVIILAGMNKVAKDAAEAVDQHFYLSICLATILYMISCYPSSASSFSVIQTGFFGISILCTRNFLWRLSPVQEL